MTNPDLPSNSRIVKANKDVEKKVEKVVQGEVVRRKKPLGRRFMETFVEGEAKGVGHYIIFNVVIPAIKDVVSDVVSQGVERMLYGDRTSPSRRSGYRPTTTTPYTSYNKPGGTPPWKRDERPVSRQARATHNFDEIVLDTRPEAEDVISHMYELIERYQQVTVSDLYDLVGIASAFTDERWGWTDLNGSGVTRIKGGYLLDLPKPDPLD
jgi:hypothetical protein